MSVNKQITPKFHIADIPIYGDKVLSPMDGFSDQPFRGLVRQMGSAISYTEFVSCIDVTLNRRLTDWRLTYEEVERPVVFQIYDDDPSRMLEAALILEEQNPDIIDVNMGCSAKAVSARGAGAGLLKTPKKIEEIFKKLTKELSMPVTAKIRIGWDEESLNYLEVAKIIEDNGGQMIAVHGRTKEQGYGGKANWDTIAEVKQAVSIPVIGNGDIFSAKDIASMKAHTKCDAVMIGRAAIGNPWIFSGLDRDQVAPAQVKITMLEHLERMINFYGEDEGLTRFRKHAKQYMSPVSLTREQRKEIFTAKTTEDFSVLLDQMLIAS
ncbi:MAG: tRNA dihydrouridine synthase DusB [Chloroflexi bacterium]|nr:tRNA dihydrouridine synthase DusB [Chloroflexota bacterium]MBT3670117.1 tRNA dihydrouridine synthase DusB [Chloroflexota bacterium]MBT4533003.1 tRNA dihydrouridine synthase DusB [Chloroflexota bacterium]MBT4682833.1 tRNA dihydrouridine synthase DusB [Chloroflexota bacterium]MBT4755161.1 tRNA dihydrouridine synthase DusB [Chloroflexota bacterium]